MQMHNVIEVITPIIHLNGDRRETLLENLENAYRAVDFALDKLRQCAPNGRNYYPAPGRMQLAEAQHRERMLHLQSVRDSLGSEAIKITEEAR